MFVANLAARTVDVFMTTQDESDRLPARSAYGTRQGHDHPTYWGSVESRNHARLARHIARVPLRT